MKKCSLRKLKQSDAESTSVQREKIPLLLYQGFFSFSEYCTAIDFMTPMFYILLYSYFCVRHRFSSNVLFSFPSAFVMWPEHIRLLTSLEDKVARQKNQKLFYCRKVQHYFPLYGSQSSKCVCPFQQYFSSQGLLHRESCRSSATYDLWLKAEY